PETPTITQVAADLPVEAINTVAKPAPVMGPIDYYVSDQPVSQTVKLERVPCHCPRLAFLLSLTCFVLVDSTVCTVRHLFVLVFLCLCMFFGFSAESITITSIDTFSDLNLNPFSGSSANNAACELTMSPAHPQSKSTRWGVASPVSSLTGASRDK